MLYISTSGQFNANIHKIWAANGKKTINCGCLLRLARKVRDQYNLCLQRQRLTVDRDLTPMADKG